VPRLIDHDERAQQIAAAALVVLARDGMTGLSVRGVAAEAGIAAASLRRAFPTQNALRVFCLERIRADAAHRVEQAAGEGRAIVMNVLTELLPLDERRRLELVSQLQLGVLAITDEALRDASSALTADVGRVCLAVGEMLSRERLLRPGLEVGEVASQLHAFLDGLALHALLSPDTDPALIEHRLHAYIDQLCVPTRILNTEET